MSSRGDVRRRGNTDRLSPVTPTELCSRARLELAELGPEPVDAAARTLWLEERRGVAVLLAALAGWDPTLCRRAALTGAEETEAPVRDVLVAAAEQCE